MQNKKCCNDPVFGYCVGEPDYSEQPEERIMPLDPVRNTPEYKWLVGGKCTRDRFNCEWYKTGEEVNKQVEGLGNKTVEIIKPVKKDSVKGKKSKAVQGEMF